MSEQAIGPIGYPGPSSSLEALKDEFWEIMQEQERALSDGTYVGMSPDLARQCEERRDKIVRICQQIADLRSKQ